MVWGRFFLGFISKNICIFEITHREYEIINNLFDISAR